MQLFLTRNLVSACAIFIGSTQLCLAQQGSLSSGGEATGPGGKVSYSIGLIDYRKAETPDFKITEGLQQPFEIYDISSVELLQLNFKCTLYPNPVTDKLILDIEDIQNKELYYVLYDLQGKVLEQQKIYQQQTFIYMKDLAAASYLVQILEKDKRLNTFKIIKH